MRLKNYLIVFFFTLLSFNSSASHIVGGEIYYDYQGANNYKITLKIYRDCFLGIAPYDDPAIIFIFNSAGTFIDSAEIPFPGSVVLPVTLDNPCFVPPTDVCVEQAIYETIVNLPDIPGGYNITYQRCCRNGTILNIVSPGDVGSTYMAHISDSITATGNSSPRYTNFPPIFLCLGVPLIFDHSATDPDGDSLYYELCDPYIGLDPICNRLGPPAPFGCPIIGSPPPYPYVPWVTPYSATNPMSALPALTINPLTGLMTGTPNMLGQWVVGVCVSEYRHGILIDANKRDFQFNVTDCPGVPVAAIPLQTTFCSGYNVDFSQTSLSAFTYHWDFGDPTTTIDTSNLESPSWTYPDSGTYVVTLIINPGTLCSDTTSNTFYVYPLLAPDFTPPPAQCVDGNSFNFTAGGSFLGSGTFSWNFGSHGAPHVVTQKNPTHIVFDSSGTFPVTFTISENGCTKSYTDSVLIYSRPIGNYGLQSPIACNLKAVHFIDSSQTDGPFTYLWNFGDGAISLEQNPFHTFTSVGTFSTGLIITSVHGCRDTVALPASLNVLPTPVADFTVTPHDTSILYPNVTSFDQSVGASDCDLYWGDGTTSLNCDTMHHFSAPGIYNVMQVVINSFGCRDTSYSEVMIYPEYLFWIPNAFTPDNDNLNDTFKPTIVGVHNYSFIIFDRWGEKIFETKDINAGWNGLYSNKLCNNDVYVYKINFTDDVGALEHQFIGSVTLVR